MSNARTTNGARVKFTIRLPPDLYMRLIKQAEKDRRTLTGVVEVVVAEYFQRMDAGK